MGGREGPRARGPVRVRPALWVMFPAYEEEQNLPALLDDLAKTLATWPDAPEAKVVVVGQGYVGLPVAMRAAEVGFRVVGLDASADRVKALQAGASYVGDVSDEVLEAALDLGYRATSEVRDVAGFDVAVISVPTPSMPIFVNPVRLEIASTRRQL